MNLILASSSPRRAEILRNAGFLFQARPVPVDESRSPGEPAEDYVQRIAKAKSHAAAAQLRAPEEHAIVIGADTVVVAAKEILGKPKDAEDARRMLRALSGKSHEVFTGLSILRIPDGAETLHVEKTRVEFLEISDEEIEKYIQTGEPFDKAGAYGIQGIGGRFVARIDGCYFNVMGLPLSRVRLTLRAMGWKDFD
jgi:septum formation protein